MNKTYLIVGGASVASLAVGAAGGYLLAKKKFDEQFDLSLSVEIDKIMKYYAGLTETFLETDKIIDPLDEEANPQEDEEEEDDEPVDPELEENAKQALTNYQGFAEKPPLESLTKNIFMDEDKRASLKKQTLPPRDPKTGLFVASKPKADFADRPRVPSNVPQPELTPYLITSEQFLENEPEHDQENCLYFVGDKTVLRIYDREIIDNDRIGEVNLTLFPDVPEGEASIICVRNEGLSEDYEIQRTDDELTDYLGLGED
jgi:hypothetical protein